MIAFRAIATVTVLTCGSIFTSCATGPSPTSLVSKKELNTYKSWACSKCDTLKNETSLKACKMVCKKESAY